MIVIFIVLFVLCPIAALLFFVRLICSPFSSKVSGQIGRHPVIHAIWACVALVGALVLVGAIMPNAPLFAALNRPTQRKQVVERVESAGGWAALQKDCDALVEQNQGEVFYWRRGRPNILPATLAALQPLEVRFVPPSVLRTNQNEPQVAVVRIKIFGLHTKGGYPSPYFGLEVVSGAGAESYRPRPSSVRTYGFAYRNYRAVTDRIYEIY